MVVGDFHLVRTLFRPAETETVLLVDSNAVLTFPVTGERFQSVARRALQIVEARGGVKGKSFVLALRRMSAGNIRAVNP